MSKQKILIVEDETIIALDLKNTISKLGYLVTDTVKNYDEALKSVLDNEPHIILMDINLKEEKDGINIAEQINKIKQLDIIYLTGNAEKEVIERAAKTNPVGYLTKPIREKQLKASLQLAAYSHQERKQPTLIELLKQEIEFYELNPNIADLESDENYLLKKYIKALEENGDFIQKNLIKISKKL